MTVINFDTISNESDLLDQIYDELTTNQNWTGRRNTGTVASNNIEVWLEKDPSDTVSGRRLLAGFYRPMLLHLQTEQVMKCV